ncbi:MAG: 50S ribosomal protein L30 [Bacteroidia bacterium]|nr:50S ribosomal protein L30 [Bacteroidia bacterium]
MPKIKVTQVRSTIKRPADQKETIKSLGLGKIGRARVFEANPALIGQVQKVSHLVRVEEVE